MNVDVIMPAYNATQTISQAIESVLQQSYPKWILWIIDDGSTDDTLSIIKKYGTHPQINILTQTNQGASAARNHALDKINGEFVAFLDADDWWGTGYLKKMLTLLQNKLDVGLVWCDMRLIFEKHPANQIYRGQREPITGNRYNTIPKMYSRITFLTSCVVCRAAPFRDGLRFPLKYRVMHDIHVWCAIANQYNIDYVNTVMVNYRIHNDSISTSAGAMSRNYEENIASYRQLYSDYKTIIPYQAYCRRMWWAHHYCGEYRMLNKQGGMLPFMKALFYKPGELSTWKNLIKSIIGRIVKP